MHAFCLRRSYTPVLQPPWQTPPPPILSCNRILSGSLFPPPRFYLSHLLLPLNSFALYLSTATKRGKRRQELSVESAGEGTEEVDGVLSPRLDARSAPLSCVFTCDNHLRQTSARVATWLGCRQFSQLSSPLSVSRSVGMSHSCTRFLFWLGLTKEILESSPGSSYIAAWVNPLHHHPAKDTHTNTHRQTPRHNNHACTDIIWPSGVVVLNLVKLVLFNAFAEIGSKEPLDTLSVF